MNPYERHRGTVGSGARNKPTRNRAQDYVLAVLFLTDDRRRGHRWGAIRSGSVSDKSTQAFPGADHHRRFLIIDRTRIRMAAQLEVRARPSQSVPFSACAARAASSFDISTKPKPRGRPVSRSLIRASLSTVPCGENRARTVSSVAVKGRFPTYSLVTATHSRNKRKRAGRPCLLVRQTFRGWQTLAGTCAGTTQGQRQTSRKITSLRCRLQESALSCRGFVRRVQSGIAFVQQLGHATAFGSA